MQQTKQVINTKAIIMVITVEDIIHLAFSMVSENRKQYFKTLDRNLSLAAHFLFESGYIIV